MDSNDEKKDKNSSKNHLNDTIDEDETITLSEILNHQQEIEEDAAAVLDGSDENFCTYSQGYIKRQALYACLSCVPESKENPQKRAGICLACSYKCHDGHQLVELYTKRNFRCDCGTSKILAIRCKLDSNKIDDNDQNQYNQNFSGVYCVCHRPYPDAEDPIDDEMIQCILCEDWYHSRHLDTKAPDSTIFEEMICSACTKKNEFLNFYSGFSINGKDDDTNTSTSEVDVTDTETPNTSAVDVNEKKQEILTAEINQCIQDIIEINKTNVQPESEASCSNENHENDGEPSAKRFKSDQNAIADGCQKPKIAPHTFTGASFWPIDWRSKLCKCIDCITVYKTNGIEFITDSDDTFRAYQEKGKAKASTRTFQDQTMRVLSGLDHVSQINAITGYNKLKEKLTEFLTTFVANEQVITSNDVNTFFQSMSNEKKN